MPKIMGESLVDHRTKTRRRLFDALAELLLEKPLENITMGSLATRAGIGRSAVYNHFEDKEAIVVAFASEETSLFIESLEHALADISDPLERLRVYVRHHREHADEYHLYLGHRLAGSLSPKALADLKPHIRLVQSSLESIINAGVTAGIFQVEDPASAVALIHSCLQTNRVPTDKVEEFVLRAVTGD